MANHRYKTVIDHSYATMQDILDGIEYYQTYYKNVLLLCTTVSFIGWMAYLLVLLARDKPPSLKASRSLTVTIAISIFLIAFIVLQRTPIEIGLFLILPVITCQLPVQNAKTVFGLLKTLSIADGFKILLILTGAEVMVASFFNKKFISLAFILLGLTESRRLFNKRVNIIGWILFTISLAVFPLLPGVNGQKSDLMLCIGFATSFLRIFLLKLKITKRLLLFTLIATANFFFCVFMHNNLEAIPMINFVVTWLSLGMALLLPLFSESSPVENRLKYIIHSLTIAYMLLSTSYDLLFVVLLGYHAFVFVQRSSANKLIGESSEHGSENSFRFAFSILVYTFFSFFGTGNLASVSSFDPNIVRCFLSTFSPFTIMFLVIVKLVIPVVVITTNFFALITSYANERRIFISLLLICDVMGLNFLFLVKNRGSWLEIGSSISHFVIMEVTTLILVLISYVARFLLTFEISRNDWKVKRK